ncbi:MAG: undecaprenyl diphosphate synthase family protein, partial [Clostridia bacterium]|nr:undecaprenyl diphosphate synthase family protein [Clostridia bacterium]
MDGNGRYAQKKGLPRTMGHKDGAENLKTISKFASDIGVKHMTVYAFSTENWKRPTMEVTGIMKLLGFYLGD